MTEDFIYKNQKAEQAILGAIMMEEQILPMLQATGLVQEMFYTPFYRDVYKTITTLQARNSSIDMAMIYDMMTNNKQITEADSLRLDECIDATLGKTMALSYLASIREAYEHRQVREVIRKATKTLETSGEDSPDEIIARIKQELSEITSFNDDEETTEDVIEALIMESRESKKTGTTGIPSRWLGIQRKLAGYRLGKIVIIAARPKCGKTTMMCNEIEYGADTLGIKSGIISLEMSTREIYKKMAAGRSKVNTIDIDNGNAGEEVLERYANALHELQQLPLHVVDATMNIEQLCATMRTMAADGITRIGIDYLQLLIPSKTTAKGNRQQEVAHWSNSINNTAKELGVSVMLLSQLSRESARDKQKPQLHHLRDSGSIEQDAAAVIFISDLQDQPTWEKHRNVIVDIAANRFGPAGEVIMKFEPYHQVFSLALNEEGYEEKPEGKKF